MKMNVFLPEPPKPHGDDKELPFPVTPEQLGRRAREMWESNLPWRHEMARPGDICFYAPNVTPARVRYWPDSSKVDQDIARSISPAWGFIVPFDASFTVLATLLDCMGNNWCWVLINGRTGWVHAADMITQEKFEVDRYIFHK